MNSGSGPAIDPTTGQPLEKIEAEATRRLNEKEKTRLKEQAGLSSITQSEASDALRYMIRDRLCRRVQKVLTEDPEAVAYMGILKDLKEKDDLAKYATDKLIQKGFL